jgi:hypothetical protein
VSTGYSLHARQRACFGYTENSQISREQEHIT